MPELKDIENIHTNLLEIGDEIRTSARWHEKIEPFSLLQQLPLSTPFQTPSEDAASAADRTETNQQNAGSQLLSILDRATSAGLALDSLDSLPETSAATDAAATPADAAPPAEYDDDLLSQVLDDLPAQIKNEIVKILENPAIDQRAVSMLIDDLIANKPIRKIRKTIHSIHGPAPLTSVGVRERAQRYREQTPLARLSARALLASIGIIFLLFLAWRFIYRPIGSHFLYLNARNAIADERFAAAEVLFSRAQDQYRFRYQLLGIANAYREQNAFVDADRYFQRYIAAYPNDIAALNQYLAFLAYQAGAEDRALALATRQFERKKFNRMLLRLLGDLQLERADRESRGDYENARYYYAYLLEVYGVDRDSLANMLRIFVRTDNQEEIAALFSLFAPTDYQEMRPLVLSELFDYLVASDQTERMTDILRSISLTEITDAGVHFQVARYFDRVDNRLAAAESLRNAEALFRTYPPQNRYQEELFIRLQGIQARLAAEQGDAERALALYNSAIERFERLLAAGVVPPRAFFGALYAGRGDIYYQVNAAYDLALADYELAQRQLYYSAALEYAVGSIHYQNFNYDRAARSFAATIGTPVSVADRNALYALANSLFFLDGYAAAIGYYRELVTLLERAIDPNLLFVDRNDLQYRDFIEMLIAVYNNIGVSYARLDQAQSNQAYTESSIAYFQRAIEQYVNYDRNSNVDLVPPPRSLPYANNFGLLHDSAAELLIYRTLPLTAEGSFATAIAAGALSSSTLSDPRVRHTESP